MPLLISDANIFIDFEEGGILEALFELDETIGVPDLLFEEELRVQHEHLIDLGLELMELVPESVARAAHLATIYPKPSRLDLTALALAEQEKCPLLTGDMALRIAAEKEALEVRGTLWICEKLVRESVLAVSELEIAYGRMEKAGRRLPWEEVRQQLRRLRK